MSARFLSELRSTKLFLNTLIEGYNSDGASQTKSTYMYNVGAVLSVCKKNTDHACSTTYKCVLVLYMRAAKDEL